MTGERKPRIVRIVAGVAASVLLGATFAPSAVAQDRRERGDRGWRGHEVERWREGDIRRFHDEDLGRWRGGRWFHGDHFGRSGWWWVVDGTWYFYPVPVYPYPDPYVPPTAVAEAPPSPTPPPAPSAPQYWYYCGSMRAYYPYVADCPEGWTPVAPQPTPPGPSRPVP